MRLRKVLRQAFKLAYDDAPPSHSQGRKPYKLSVWFDVSVVIVCLILGIGLWF